MNASPTFRVPRGSGRPTTGCLRPPRARPRGRCASGLGPPLRLTRQPVVGRPDPRGTRNVGDAFMLTCGTLTQTTTTTTCRIIREETPGALRRNRIRIAADRRYSGRRRRFLFYYVSGLQEFPHE